MEHRTVSLAEQVFDRLENEILSGKFPRGAVMTEMNLVSELGVSRTPIREAIHRLEQEHIIETTTKGILILGVTKKDLRDIFEIRMRIEGLAAAEAAKGLKVTYTRGYDVAADDAPEALVAEAVAAAKQAKAAVVFAGL